MLIQNEQQQQQQPQAKQQQQQKLTAIDAGCSSNSSRSSRQRESRRRIMSISFYAVRQCPNYLPFSLSLSPAHSHALPFAATAAKAKKKKLSYALTRRCCQAASLSPCALALFAAPHCELLLIPAHCALLQTAFSPAHFALLLTALGLTLCPPFALPTLHSLLLLLLASRSHFLRTSATVAVSTLIWYAPANYSH